MLLFVKFVHTLIEMFGGLQDHLYNSVTKLKLEGPVITLWFDNSLEGLRKLTKSGYTHSYGLRQNRDRD